MSKLLEVELVWQLVELQSQSYLHIDYTLHWTVDEHGKKHSVEEEHHMVLQLLLGMLEVVSVPVSFLVDLPTKNLVMV